MSIPAGVIDQFIHPILRNLVQDVTTPTPLANPYSGTGSLPVSSFILPGAYGITWQVQTYPGKLANAGMLLPVFTETIMQLVVYYKIGDGSYVPDIIENVKEFQGLILFDIAYPDHIDYWIFPGLTMNFSWLR